MQINRMFEIIYLLLEKDKVTAAWLAAHFEVSTRTIYRDIEALSEAGIPVYMSKGKGGGISLLPDFVLDKTILTEEEKQQLLSSLAALGKISPKSTDTALAKLNSLFGSTDADWVEVDFCSWSNSHDEAETFARIKEAILDKQVISFSYVSNKGEKTRRIVEPAKLCFKAQAWYLYAYCRDRADFRFFKIRRIKDLLISKEKFERIMPKKVFDSEYLLPCEPVSVKLKLSPNLAYRVYDEFTDPEILADGSFIVSTTFPHGEWLYQYLISFGEQAEVLEPTDIRNKLKEKLEEMINIYS